MFYIIVLIHMSNDLPSSITLEPSTGNLLIPPHLLVDIPSLQQILRSDIQLLSRISALNTTLANAITQDSCDLLEDLINQGRGNSQPPEVVEEEEENKRINCCNEMLRSIPSQFPELLSNQGNDSMLPYLPIHVNGFATLASVDSGCTHSILTPAEAKRVGVERVVDKRITGSLAGIGGEGGSMFLGKVHLAEVAILTDDGRRFNLPTSFHIVNNSLQECILGMDFLVCTGSKIDLRQRMLEIEWRGNREVARILLCGERERERMVEERKRAEGLEPEIIQIC